MSDFYKTLVHWQDPTGQFHEVGEIAEIDPSVVFDLADLARIYTVVKVDAPILPEEKVVDESVSEPVTGVVPVPTPEPPPPAELASEVAPIITEAVG